MHLRRRRSSAMRGGRATTLPAGFVPEDAVKVLTAGRNAGVQERENGRFRCCLVCGDCHATLYDHCCRSNDLRRRLRYTCADFHSNVTQPLTGLATPLTSTTTNCMMTCNSQVANCRTACLIPAVSSGTASSGTTTSNATGSTACLLTCSSTHLTCQTVCAQVSPSR